MAILQPDGLFRILVPDLEAAARKYLDSKDDTAADKFLEGTFLGYRRRPRGVSGVVRHFIGNKNHLWMWDFKGLAAQLTAAGFRRVRRAQFGDSSLSCFREVEDAGRWNDGFGIECAR